MMAVPQRLDGGFDDVLGRAEVRLADPEIDDVLAGLRERSGARQDGEGAAAAAICEHYATIKAEVAEIIEAGDL